MKTKVLAGIILCLFFIKNLQSQNLHYGIAGGFNLVSFDITNIPELEYTSLKPGDLYSYSVNAFLGYNFGKYFELVVEPGFFKKGGIENFKSTKYPVEFEQSSAKTELYYLTLPILFEYFPEDKFGLALGVEPAYLVNEKAYVNGVKAQEFVLNHTDISALLGINYRINTHFEFLLRYGHGLIPIEDKSIHWVDDDGAPIGQSNFYNHAFQAIFRLHLESLLN